MYPAIRGDDSTVQSVLRFGMSRVAHNSLHSYAPHAMRVLLSLVFVSFQRHMSKTR
jgi:hypothetical protein